MKKLILTLVTLVTATAASAQIVLWNGNDKEVGSDGGFWDRANPTVVIEEGNEVLKITTKANPGGWDKEQCNAALPLGDADFKGLRRLTLKMKMGIKHNVLVKLVKDGDGGYSTGRLLWLDNTEGWNKLTFEFAAGPDNEKITDTGNTVLEIWPFQDGDDALSNIGQTIYIDDIQLEGPMVNGSAIRTLGDNALTDQQVIVTGSLSKGQYQCTWDGDWHSVDYDDYATLTSKISADVCFLNLTGAVVSDCDSHDSDDNQKLRQKNSNLLILSPTDFFVTDNVIRWDGEKNITPKMVLDEIYPFYSPIEFTATTVELKRGVKDGINTFCLPFEVTPSELSETKIATYTSSTADAVNFTTADHADANVPFITVDATEVDKETGFTFSNKTIKATPASLGTPFQGTYKPLTDTSNKYGINKDGKFQKGSTTSVPCYAFHAYLTEIPSTARSIDIDGETTGISNVSLENPVKEIYNLNGVRVDKIGNKGIYIINGKKVIVK